MNLKNKEQVWGKKFLKQQNHVEPRKNFPTYKNMLVNSGQIEILLYSHVYR